MKSFCEWLENRDPEYYEENWRERLGKGVEAVKAGYERLPDWGKKGIKAAGVIGAGALVGTGIGAGMAGAGIAAPVAAKLLGGAGAITGAKYLAQKAMEKKRAARPD